ncbi:MAG: hypothetical protein ACRDI1_02970 [Actinomycetota bacterium]
MPVLVFASVTELDVVRPLARALRADGGEVRCYLDDDDYELRNMGCKLAVGRPDDDGNLEGALTNVHTFIPILPDPAGIRGAEDLKALGAIGRAAGTAGASAGIVQTICGLPALMPFDNPLGQAFREVEEGLQKCRPLCLIRTGLLWGEDRPLPGVAAALVREGGTSASRVSSLVVDDFVAAVAAADDHEDLDGVWELGGPSATLEDIASTAEPTSAHEWIGDILRHGLTVGSSASGLLGVTPRALPSRIQTEGTV